MPDETTVITRQPQAWNVPGWTSPRPDISGNTPEIWCYTDKFSYFAGESIQLHVDTTANRYSVEIIRDGCEPLTVFREADLVGKRNVTPNDAYAAGCDWPVSTVIQIDPAWGTGFYLIIASIEVDGVRYSTEHFFVLKAPRESRGRVALVLTTSTLLAYNDWGGANGYRGLGDEPYCPDPAFVSAVRRPIARGFLRIPGDAPRNAHSFTPPPGWVPDHENYEFAHAYGYSRHYADAFWAMYERPFVVWAERNGYALDYLTQHDLHFDENALDGYDLVLLVGHDEYWSWEMRDRIDAFTDNGGNIARFGGNFIWQVRLSEDGSTQDCYRVPAFDPLREIQPSRVTTVWDAPIVGRPAAASLGLTGTAGVYNRYGNAAPRSTGGFTVYRPDHWVFKGTDLYYGDTFGGAPICIAAFEMDGVEYTFRKGLPYPTGDDGAPSNLEILALAPATAGQTDRWGGTVPLGAPLHEVTDLIDAIYDGNTPDHMKDREYGAGMIGVFERGEGVVFNAGSTEWVSGLIHKDPYTEQITHNVLRRLTQ
ncbi:N,N-dimethylformamidase beta subunit family domain-containing protein [Burkholderia cepacia]|uniref:N,N-dimethylformamidase beta subunit family domain-containing protein n=1 Tax=Burkholderia cepacia TaxID=292 RepID=UPI000AB08FEF|nr:N,N-dimethylformamidase beta subunit family domain-containing protein [Burkholderia cepacia]